jgi:hypothetical protein
MSKNLFSRSLVCTLLVSSGLLAGVQSADAATARLKFTPPYGSPFPNLEWSGEAVVDDNNCTSTGLALNFGSGACSGQFSFLSASLTLENLTGPASSTTINFLPSQFGQVAAVQRTTTNPDDWTGVYSSAFRAVQAPAVSGANYAGSPAYFSLIFVGSFAQLIWFRDDPGIPLFASGVPLFEKSLEYAGCYALGSGDKSLKEFGIFGAEINRCGLSDANNAKGAALQISVVPEPEAYMMALASLGVLGFASAISRRRRGKA